LTDKPKLLWHSNSGWAPTGYGNQTGLFTPRLVDLYDLRVSSFYGLEGAPLIWNGVKHLPGLGGTYGNESLPHHVANWFDAPRDGMVVTLMDVWVLDAKLMSRFDTVSWVPVDHEPCPPAVMSYFRQSGAIPLAMTRFGMEEVAEFDPLYVPHGVDTTVFRPVEGVREHSTEVSPDQFVVGMVAANKGNSPSRKSFVAALQAFAEFYRTHDDAVLYLHTDLEGLYGHGVPLLPVLEAVGLPEKAVRVASQYAIHFKPDSPHLMAALYSALDVLLSPSMGEGFGIPIVEAQACGTPVITTDFSAMREVTGAGWRVGGSRFWTGQQSWQVLPEVSDIVEALKRCYSMSKAEAAQVSEQARTHALQYDADRVFTEHMVPALEQAQARFDERKPVHLKAVA
jgi:glycosyltransferase involved in cell wall biosynthesis